MKEVFLFSARIEDDKVDKTATFYFDDIPTMDDLRTAMNEHIMRCFPLANALVDMKKKLPKKYVYYKDELLTGYIAKYTRGKTFRVIFKAAYLYPCKKS